MIIPVKPDAYGNIDIFYEGDENVTQVHFENPDSDFKWALHYLRRGDKRPYNVPLEEADGELIWIVSLADTEKPGAGFAQLVGSAEGQTKHRRPYTVTVRKSLGKPGDVPAAEKAFGDAVAADAAKAVKAAEDAAASAKSAGTDADKAEAALKTLENGIASGDFRGEKGEKGDTGPQGPKGDTGPQGPDGDTTAADAAAKAAEAAAQAAKTAAEASAGSAASAAESVGGFAGELAATKAALATAQKDLAKAQRAINLQAKLTQGQVWDFEVAEQAAYQRTVPSGAHAGAVMSYGGKTVASDGELVSAEVDEVIKAGKNVARPLPAFSKTGITMSVDTVGVYHFSGTATENVDDRSNRFDLPSGTYTASIDVAAPRNVYLSISSLPQLMVGTNTVITGKFEGGSAFMYLHIGKGTVMDNVSLKFQVERGSAHTAYVPYREPTTHPIPAAVQSLPGYGWSAGAVANSVERTDDGWQYVQRVGSRAYQDGDELTDGTTTYYALETPVTTDITDLMGDALEPFDVEPGGTITFHSPTADDGFLLDVPAKIQYITKLSEVTADA